MSTCNCRYTSCKVFLIFTCSYAYHYHFICGTQVQGLNYADLDIGMGPSRFGGGEHAVDYGQVTDTNKLKKVIEKLM